MRLRTLVRALGRAGGPRAAAVAVAPALGDDLGVPVRGAVGVGGSVLLLPHVLLARGEAGTCGGRPGAGRPVDLAVAVVPERAARHQLRHGLAARCLLLALRLGSGPAVCSAGAGVDDEEGGRGAGDEGGVPPLAVADEDGRGGEFAEGEGAAGVCDPLVSGHR